MTRLEHTLATRVVLSLTLFLGTAAAACGGPAGSGGADKSEEDAAPATSEVAEQPSEAPAEEVKELAPEDLWIANTVVDPKTGFPMPTKGNTDIVSQGEGRDWPTNYDYEGMDQVLINKGIAKLVQRMVKEESWSIKDTDSERCGDKPDCGDVWQLENLDGEGIEIKTAPSPVVERVLLTWSG